MLEVIQGVPGSGKSYYAVKKLLEKDEKISSKGNKAYYTITNIDGCTFVDEFIDAQIGKEIAAFLLARDWEKFAQQLDGRKIYLVIDEAQRVYPSTGMDRSNQQDLLYFLEYHRHYGMDVTLITQSKNSLNSRVYPLLHQICVVSKVSLAGKQRVRIHDPNTWEIIETKSFRRSQKVFDAYRSATVEAGMQKPVNPLKRIMWIGGVAATLFVVAGFFLFRIVSGFISENETIPDQQAENLKVEKLTSKTPQPPPQQQPEQQIDYSQLYHWILPDYGHVINSKTCIKGSSDFSWYCPNLPEDQRVKLLANISYCVSGRCNYVFEDQQAVEKHYEKLKPRRWSSAAGASFDLPSFRDFSETGSQAFRRVIQ